MGDRDSARRKLDRILDTLEQLNLRLAETMPARLRTDLEVLGIGAASKPDFTVLIDHVLELQEELLGRAPGGIAQGSARAKVGSPANRRGAPSAEAQAASLRPGRGGSSAPWSGSPSPSH